MTGNIFGTLILVALLYALKSCLILCEQFTEIIFALNWAQHFEVKSKVKRFSNGLLFLLYLLVNTAVLISEWLMIFITKGRTSQRTISSVSGNFPLLTLESWFLTTLALAPLELPWGWPPRRPPPSPGSPRCRSTSPAAAPCGTGRWGHARGSAASPHWCWCWCRCCPGAWADTLWTPSRGSLWSPQTGSFRADPWRKGWTELLDLY